MTTLDDVIVVEIGAYDPNVGARTLYFATGTGFTTLPSDTPANTHIAGRVKQALDIQRTLFAPRATRGRSTVSVGDLKLLNGDGELDALKDWGFDGRTLTVRRGAVGAAYPSGFSTELVATMYPADFSQDLVTIRVRDRSQLLNVPLQTTKYAGTGSLEGGEDLAGKPKPVLYGAEFGFGGTNVPLPCVETTKLIYHVADLPGSSGMTSTETVAAVYDQGVALARTAGDYASDADLLDNALAPPAGEFKVRLASTSGIYIRLGSSPVGLLTADVVRNNAAPFFQAATVATAILEERAGFTSSDWNAADVTALNATEQVGWRGVHIWEQDETTIDRVMDILMAGPGAAWFFDALGIFRMRQLAVPTGTAVATITEHDLVRPLERIASNDEGRGVPSYKCVFRFRHNYTVQNTDLAAGITAAHRSFVSKDYRTITITDSAVQTAHPGALQSVITTRNPGGGISQAVPGTEFTRQAALRAVAWDMYEATVKWAGTFTSIELGDEIELQHDRFGISLLGEPEIGTNFIVIGIEVDAEARELTFTLWGGGPQDIATRVTQDDYVRITSDGYYRRTAA